MVNVWTKAGRCAKKNRESAKLVLSRKVVLVVVVVTASIAPIVVTAGSSDKGTADDDDVLEVVPVLLSIFAGILLAWVVVRSSSGDSSNLATDGTVPPSFTMRRPTRAIRDITRRELAEYDGRGASSKIWIAVKGEVFDVTSHPSGVDFYGPGGTYESFAGKDATVGLALSSYDEEDFEGKTMDDPSIGWWERERLDEWYQTFQRKYNVVGQLSVSMHVEDAPPAKGLSKITTPVAASGDRGAE
eukprot:g365.t1